MAEKILVIGASGPVGISLVSEFSLAMMPVIAAVESRADWERARLSYVDVVRVSYDEPDSLTNVIAESDRVFFNLPLVPSHIDWLKKALEVARKNRLRHFVYLSSILALSPKKSHMGTVQSEAEYLTTWSGVPFTILRPVAIMQDFLEHSRPIDGKLHLPCGRCHVSYVDARDVALLSMYVLTHSGHEGLTYDISGKDAISIKEVAGRLSMATGKKIGYQNTSPGLVKQFLFSLGNPNWLVDSWMEEYSAWREGLGEVVSKDFTNVVGREPIDFEQFARDYSNRV